MKLARAHRSLGKRVLSCAIALALASTALSAAEFIIVQSTTSTEASGLFRHVLPRFTEATGIEVRVVAVGTGQAIKNARNGDGDVLLVHAKPDEEKFVADGFGIARHDLMYNDFVIVGPASDPAAIAGEKSAADALKRIHRAKAPFVSRGDDSGTHKAELRLWQAAGIDPSKESGTWYREAGSGMGETLNTAVAMDAYTLTDRATWISFQNKREATIKVEGDPALFNQYGIIAVNPEKHPRVKAKAGQQFVDWMLSETGQEAIASFKVEGQQLFFPNAER